MTPISPRERQVWQLIATGFLRKEIATKLGISMKTVDLHITSLYAKLGMPGRSIAKVTLEAVRQGVITL